MLVKKQLSDVQRKFESESLILFEWFHDNYVKANIGKFRIMLTTDNKLNINIRVCLLSNEQILMLL